MCTSLLYVDANEMPYYGRTMELDVEEPWIVAYVPTGMQFASQAPGHDPLHYESQHPYVAVTAPGRLPTEQEPLRASDLKILEGVNAAGLTFSLLAYPGTTAGEQPSQQRLALLQATDLGSWILGQFATANDVKAALQDQGIFLAQVAAFGNAIFPFHVVVHDKTGAAIVVEWINGTQQVYDNPVGVMTNGPAFPWHLTNLGNWTHLNNVDQSSAQFGTLAARQPDSGIATASLPGSSTSVGRFIRAVFYATYSEKARDANQAMLTLARIMDNFDRPRGVSVSPVTAGGEGIAVQGIASANGGPRTEFTCWTILADLSNGLFFLRCYNAFNYTRFDLNALKALNEPRALPASKLDPMGGDGTQALSAALRL